MTFSSRRAARKPYAGEAISGPADARPMGDYVTERIAESPVEYERSDRQLSNAEGFHKREGGEILPRGSTTAQSSAILKGFDKPIRIGSPTAITRSDTNRALEQERTAQVVAPATPPAYQSRQLLRARTRGISLADFSLTVDSRIDGESPRQTSALPRPTMHVPSPTDRKHVGMGGFPIPIHLVGRVLPQSAQVQLRNRLARPERRHELLLNRTETVKIPDIEDGNVREDGWDELRATVASWMPEKLSGLVIGRNSRFFTEELDDEELEQIGGVEYRALRLLSYLVPAVRVRPFLMSTALNNSICSSFSSFHLSSLPFISLKRLSGIPCLKLRRASNRTM